VSRSLTVWLSWHDCPVCGELVACWDGPCDPACPAPCEDCYDRWANGGGR